ncbi:MAG TPA: amino acid adenylation domain-containing protein [Puia sp.]|nr:amino acid adenylation domain-containing protein [Puia sp.]
MPLLVPATPQQDSIWFHATLNGTSYWNFCDLKCFKGIVDIPVMKKALSHLIKRHSSLRTNFVLRDRQIWQDIIEETPIDDIFGVELSDEERPEAINKIVRQEVERLLKIEFDLGNGNLFIFKLCQFKDLAYLIVVVNHIIADVISMQIFWNELSCFYNLLTNGEDVQPARQVRQYYDFSTEQERFFETPEYEARKAWWLNKLPSQLPNVRLPFYKDRSGAEPVVKEAALPPGLIEQIRLFALQNRVIYSAVFQAAYFILLYKYSGQQDIMIGNVTHGRGSGKKKNGAVIGQFANRLIHIQTIRPKTTIRTFLLDVNKDLVSSLKNDELPFDELVRHLAVKKENGSRPLFQAVFDFVKDAGPPVSFTGLREFSSDLEFPARQPSELQYDSKLLIFDAVKDVRLNLLVMGDGSSGTAGASVLDSYLQILRFLVDNPDDEIAQISLTGNEDTLSLLRHSESKLYWLDQFSGEWPVSKFPADKAAGGGRGDHAPHTEAVQRIIPSALTHVLTAVAERSGATLVTGLLGVVGALLFRYTHQEDIVLATLSEEGDQALPLKIRINPQGNFAQLLDTIKKRVVEANRFRSYAMEDHSLFDVMVACPYNEQMENKCSLTMAFTVKEDGLLLQILYNSDIYYEETIHRLAGHIEQILVETTRFADQPLSVLDYLQAAEKNQLLYGFNDTTIDFPKQATLVDLFLEQVDRSPDKLAVSCGDKLLTYRQLDQQSNRLAYYLKKNYFIRPDDLVAVLLDRSELTIVALWGILRSGGAYVPIAVNTPADRKKKMIENSGCKVVISQSAYLAEMAGFEVAALPIDNLPEESIREYTAERTPSGLTSGNLAYVMYTSGSTGEPKGVMVTHRNVARLVKNTNYITIGETDNILSLSDFSFDGSVFDIFGSLLNGASLVIPTLDILLDPTFLGGIVKERSITVFFITTALFNSLVDAGFSDFGDLQFILFGGEQVSLRHVAKFKENYPAVNLIHVYGPTENTTFSTYYPVGPLKDHAITVPIGKGIGNSRVYILDAHGRLVPVGVPGELYVGGEGVARGYLNDKALTAEKFLPDPFVEGERMYKTGDWGRWLPEGNIEFIGRNDDQVKIRGYRMELREIERALTSHVLVDNAVVVARESGAGDKELVAYIVSKTDLSISLLRSALSGQLPAYMLPSSYVRLEKIPLNSNGKVNRKALPSPAGTGMNTGVDFVPPVTELGTQLAAIWSEVLSVEKEKISAKDDFFVLGGHSLKVTRLAGQICRRLGIQLGLKELFTHTIFEDQEHLIARSQKSALVRIPPIPVQKDYPLSSAQRRLWVLSQFEDANVAYNIPMAYELEGPLNQDALAATFRTLIGRHEILRTTFRQDLRGEVRQHISPPELFHFTIQYRDFRDMPSREEEIADFLQEQGSAPFDLAAGPLFRLALAQLEDNQYVLSYVVHHIISDGWSFEIMLRELSILYAAYISGRPDPLPPLIIQYKDYTAWQMDGSSSAVSSEHKTWWLEQFSGELPVLDLPADKVRPAVKTYNGGAIYREWSKEKTDKLKGLARECGGTLFMSLLGLVNTLLYRYTGQSDVVIGSPIAGRGHIDLEEQIGFYVNMLPFRTRFSGKDSFKELMEKTKKVTLASYEHQSYPFDELVDQLHLIRDTSRSPLFDVMIALQNAPVGGRDPQTGLWGNIHVREFKGAERVVSKFDLSFNFIESEDKLLIDLEYNSDLYERRSIGQLLDHLDQLLLSIVIDPDQPIEDCNGFSHKERQQLLFGFNETGKDFPGSDTILHLLERQVQRTPENIAVACESETLTYARLNELSDQMAGYLRATYDIRPGDLIGIQLHRSASMIIAILGVLKSGGAYVPIDPEYPQERIDYMLSESNCKVRIDQEELERFNTQKEAFPGRNLPSVISGDDLAYVIYTSGSTGKPKGVMIEHGNISSFIHWCIDEFKDSQVGTVLGVTSICFDLSVFEIFYTLATGKKLRIVGNALAVGKHLQEEDNILFNTVPGIVKVLLKEGMDLGRVKVLNMAGEPVPDGIIDKIDLEATEVRNLYGPSEDTTYSTCYRIKGREKILIGRPIANTQVYITDHRQKLVISGAIGEICLGGAGLARGYLNDPSLTSEKFVPDPFGKELRLYRTGDLGRWLSDGNIEFIGRIDQQVKIRGYRIELGEIERALQEYEGIEAAVVIAMGERLVQKELVAYIVGAGTLQPSSIRKTLSRKLPVYMLPSYYVQLEKIPLMPNGKIDKKALPPPEGMSRPAGKKLVAPGNEREEKLAALWSEVLSIEKEKISIEDDFFDLGGDSFKAIRASSIEGLRVPAGLLYKHRTIREYAEFYPYHAMPVDELLIRKNDLHRHTLNMILVNSMGASDMLYFSLSGRLSEFCNVYTVEMPWNRNSYKGDWKDHTSVKEKLVKEIQEKIAGDTLVLGHSSGASLALAISYELEKLDYPLVGLFQCAAMLDTPSTIERKREYLVKISDGQLWDDFVRVSGLRDFKNGQQKKTFLNGLRHDAIIGCDILLEMLNQKAGAVLKAPIHLVYGEKDDLTADYRNNFQKWNLFASDSTLNTIDHGGHYFVSENVEDLVQIIRNKI